ncbi:MAG: trans-sulfuration enzyme family protein [Planctomycetota bacterium]|jgi:cystathionine beta-lyase/cystathionine gamma-synthase
MPDPRQPKWSFDTRTVHHPEARADSPPVAAPLYQTSTFRAADAATIARYADQTQPQSYYTRWGNPTVEVWEKVMADLEGGEKCLAFASGMAAVSTTLLSLLSPGDHVVAGASLYTATTEVLSTDLPALGITVDFVDPTDAEAFARAARRTTRMLYLETPTNPTMLLTDLAAVCQLGLELGIPTVVDNTFATPYNQRPLAAGADVVIHSATKYLSGHTDVVAGCVVTDAETAERLWHKRTMLGGSLDPFAAWLLLRGMKTLALRIQRHNSNAIRPPNERLRGHGGLRAVRRSGGRHSAGRIDPAGPSGRQPRRRGDPDRTPRLDVPRPVKRRAAPSGRHPAGTDPSVGRHRGSRRSDRRPSAGAGSVSAPVVFRHRF